MTRALWARLTALLLLSLVVGSLASVTADDTRAVGLWPVGLLTGLLLWAPPVGRLATTGVAALSAATAFLITGHGMGPSAYLGLQLAAEAWVVVTVLGRGRRDEPSLIVLRDLGRFAEAVVAGGVVGAVGTLGLSLLQGDAHPWSRSAATLVAHVAAQALVIPFFIRLSRHEALAGRVEAIVQWIAVLVVSVVVFAPDRAPAIAFVVLPFLCWGALRRTMLETAWQLLMVAAVVGLTTSLDRGPFTAASSGGQLSSITSVLVLQAFAIACVTVALPLSMAVGQQRLLARDASVERERLHHIVRSASGVAILGTDERGRLNLFNPGAVELTGYQPEEVLGLSPAMFHTEDEIARQAAKRGLPVDFGAVATAVTGPSSNERVEWRLRRKDGEIRSVSTRITTLTDDDGHVIGHVAAGEDITDLVRTQEALLAALEAERQAVERLTGIDAAKDRFVSNVSHELRTPITNIVGYLEMLQDGMYGDHSPAQLEALGRIGQNSERLLLLIEDLLTLSQVEDRSPRVTLSSTDLRDTIDRVCEVVAPSLSRRALAFDVRKPEAAVPAEVDEEKLERLLINLLNNAIKFTPDGGRVDLELDTRGDRVVMIVRDTGMGISEDDQERLFTRFFRSTTAEEHAIPGTGLGLSIAHNIAALHGGELTVTSAVGEGSTFKVTLPRLVG